MLYAKFHPGQYNVDYVAGMNNVSLPTNIFSVSNTYSEAKTWGGAYVTAPEHLGRRDYTVIMWSSSMTAFSGDGAMGMIPSSDRLGGFAMFQMDEAYIDSPFISRSTFIDAETAETMKEIYGSDMKKFSAGGYVWASEAQFNLLQA